MPPVAHKPQTGGLCHFDKILWSGIEGNCGSTSYYCRSPSELPVGHFAQHPEPRSQAVFAVKVGKHFCAAGKLRARIVNFYKRNFSQEYAGVRFGDSVDLAQARGNLIPRNHQQYAVTYNNRCASIGDGETVRQSLFDVEAKPTKHSDFLLGGEQSDRGPGTATLGHS